MATPKPRLSDSAKNALRNQRRRLATEQADAEARRAMEARSVLNRKTQATQTIVQTAPTSTQDPNVVAFHRGVIPRCSAVLASQNVTARIIADLSSGAKYAYTDFTDINLAFPVANKPDLDVAEVSAILRGLIYHEGGHCEHTEPFMALYDRYMANPAVSQAAKDAVTAVGKNLLHYSWNLSEDSRMEMLTVEDSPRKAAYFAPMVIDMVINYRPDAKDAAKELHDRVVQWMYSQRIITMDQAAAMPFDDAAYERQRVAPYPLIAWRRYLPRNLRLTMRQAFVKVHGLTKTVQIERCILRYMKATDDATAIEALVELAPLLRDVMTPPDTSHDRIREDGYYSDSKKQRPERHAPSLDDAEQEYDGDGEGEGGEGGDEQDSPSGSGKQGMPSDKQGTQRAKGKGDESSDQQGEGDGDGKGTKPGQDPSSSDQGNGSAAGAQGEGDQGPQGQDGGHSDGRHGNGAGTGTGDHGGSDDMSGVDEMLAEAKAEAESVRNSDSAVQGDVQAFNQAITDLGDGSLLIPYHTTPTTDAAIIAQARNMAEEMVQAFHEVNTEHQPTWQEQQTRGVLNVGRYLTRQHGDREFFRCWADEVVPGRNIAVSVLLDYSGSMGGKEASLSATAYAMKSACDQLEIPCTVVLWDHEATLLWDGRDTADSVPVINAQGGTNPHMALEDMPRHRHDKDAHIVLVMTDAQFSVHDNWLNKYRTEGTFFIGAVLGPKPGSAAATSTEATMAQMGFDRYGAMDTLSPLVSMLESAIIDLSQAVV